MDVKEKMKLQRWAAEMEEQKASGLTHKQWCNMQGISTSCFEYRCTRVRRALEKEIKMSEKTELATVCNEPVAVPSPAFAKIELKPDSDMHQGGIDIRIGNVTVHIAPDSNTDHLRIVMEALAHAK